MRYSKNAFYLSLLLAGAVYQSVALAETPVLTATELSRFHVAEARQGVAVDERYFYAIDNKRIAKYPKNGGALIAIWNATDGDGIRHLNSCYEQEKLLICSHSNYSLLPVLSSLETYNTEDMSHVASHSLGFFGSQYGSLTWAQPYQGYWWAGFANYDEKGTEAGRNHTYTAIVKMDDEGRPVQSWAFPANVLAKFAPKSSSGGGWGPDDLLYVTGHDAKELYVLRLPQMGSTLEYITTISVPFEGQAWAWDKSTKKRIIYGITRNSNEVIATEIPSIPTELLPRRVENNADQSMRNVMRDALHRNTPSAE